MSNELTEEQVKDLEYFSKEEGTEIGELIEILLYLINHESYINDETLIEKANNELQYWHNYYIKNTKIVEKEKTIKYRELQIKGVDF